MRPSATLALAASLLLAAGCPTVDVDPPNARTDTPDARRPRVKPKEVEADGPLVHEGSGMVFPESIGPFRRVQIVQYDADGVDMSFRYDMAGPGPLAPAIMTTVYVYPRPVGVPVAGSPDWAGWREAVLQSHFEEVKDQIRAYRRGAVLLSEGETSVVLGGEERTGLHATFRCPQVYPDVTMIVFSEAYLFVHGDWFLKYRISYLEEYRERFEPHVERLLRMLKWP
jgi:hypothetical protein